MIIQDDVPKNVKKQKEQLHMRKITLRKVVCLTAAAVISNMLYAGNSMQVSARQIPTAKQAAVSLQCADQTVVTHQADDRLYHTDPEKDALVEEILRAEKFPGRFTILFHKKWYRQSRLDNWVVRGLFLFNRML